MKPFDPTLTHDPEPELVPFRTREAVERRSRMEYDCRNADFLDDLNRTFGLLVCTGIALLFLCFACWLGRTMEANNARQDKVVQAVLRATQ